MPDKALVLEDVEGQDKKQNVFLHKSYLKCTDIYFIGFKCAVFERDASYIISILNMPYGTMLG